MRLPSKQALHILEAATARDAASGELNTIAGLDFSLNALGCSSLAVSKCCALGGCTCRCTLAIIMISNNVNHDLP